MTPAGVATGRPGGRGRRGLIRLGLLALFIAGVAVGAPSGFGLFWFVPYAGVGSLLIVRRPETWIGPILLGIGWALVAATITLDVTVSMYSDGTLGAVNAVLSVATASAGMAAFFLFGLLAILFPTGRLPSGRWRPLARAAIAAGLVVLLAGALMPTITVSVWGEGVGQPVHNPASILPGLGLWDVVTPDTVVLPLAFLMVVAVASLLVRYGRSRDTERQQMKWLASALALVVVAVVGGFVLGILSPDLADSGVVWLGAIVAFPLVPVAIGIAVMRYRLYEIDRIVSRTVGWLVLTAVLAAMFAALVVGLQALLVSGDNTIAVAASTLIAASLFQPLRRGIQRAVDRRFDRTHYDANRAMGEFSARLRDQVDLSVLTTEVSQAVHATVRPASAGVWLRVATSRSPGAAS